MTLEEKIKQMLAEAASKEEQDKAETVTTEDEVVKDETVEEAKVCSKDEMGDNDDGETVVDLNPKMKKDKKKSSDSKISEQVSAILETEGLSEEFKVQAITIFEAAVSDRVSQIREELESEYEEKFEQEKTELNENIDGYLSEAVQTWIAENEVAIESNFKSQVAISFMEGLNTLMTEHKIEIPEGSEDAFESALGELETLEKQLVEKDETLSSLEEEIAILKADKILESYKEKMTSTEFDRFTQLVESIGFKEEDQYKKQLDIVLENFSVVKTTDKTEVKNMISEEVNIKPEQVNINESVNKYASFISNKASKGLQY